MDWLFMTDEAIVAELGTRCRRERLAQNITQGDLAERAGIGVNTLRRFEGEEHHSPSLETFVRILRVLGGLDALDTILPERPLDPLNPDVAARQRARPSASSPAEGEWTWGDS